MNRSTIAARMNPAFGPPPLRSERASGADRTAATHEETCVISNLQPGDEAADPLSFVLGQDRRGHWVVQEAHGLYGGLFTSKIAAIHYAKFESADRGAVFEVVTEPIEWSSALR